MGFHRVVLPRKFFGRNTATGPQHQTGVPEADSGVVDVRVSRWPQHRGGFELVRNASGADARELAEFVLARRGMAHSFLIRDEEDFSTAADDVGTPDFDDVVIGTGNGSDTEFELSKKYGAAGFERTRILRRIETGTVRIGVGPVGAPVELTYGVHWTVDHDLGRVTIDPPPPDGDEVTAGFQFYTEVRFSQDVDRWLNSIHVDFDQHSLAVGLVEETTATDAGPVQCVTDLEFYGGAARPTFLAAPNDDFAPVDFSTGRFVLVDGHTTPKNIILPWPRAADMPLGGPYFAIYNGGTAAVNLFEYTNAAQSAFAGIYIGGTIQPHRLRECFLSNPVQPRQWVAR